MRRLPAPYARLIKSCERRGRTLEDAEDLVQEAYLRLVEYRRTSKVVDEKTFLARIVNNLTINLYRRERILSFASESVEELDEQGQFAERTPSPERILVARQRLEAVLSMLSAVSGRTCRVFVLSRSGYLHRDIAARLGISRRTVQKHLARASLLVRIMIDAQQR